MSNAIRFTAVVEAVLIEEGFDPAFFVTLPETAGALVTERKLALGRRGGFGTMRVDVRLGCSHWQTTLNSRAGVWTLPLKKPVRIAEDFAEGDTITLELELV